MLLPPVWLAWRNPRWLVAFAFIAGLSWTGLRAGLIVDDNLAAELEGQDLVLEGHVADIPQASEYGYRFLFDVTNASLDATTITVPSRVLLSAGFGEQVPRAGQGWRIRVRLIRPHGFQNPGGFDYEAFLFRSRIRARGSVREWVAPLPNVPLRYRIDAARESIGEKIHELLGERAQAGVVVALVNGHARGVTPQQWDVFRATGTLHLVAISGLHISLVAGIAFFLGRWAWALPGRTVLWVPAQMAGALAALVAAAGYAALAGFVIPTQRALIMVAVAMGGVLLRQSAPPAQVLAAALLAVLVYDPLAVLAPGFWLSFAAVAAILYAMQQTGQPWWRRLGYVQWAIGFGLLPLMLWHFQQVSVVGPLANLLAVPVFDLLVVPLSLFGLMLVHWLPGMAALCFQAAEGLLALLWPVLEFLAALPFAQWWQHQPPLWALFCGMIAVVLLLAPRGWPGRAVGAAWLLPLFLVKPPAPGAGEVWFTLLDVGQGLAAVVRTEHHALVYDTGPRFSANFDTGESVVVPYLRQAGIRHIDRLVVSHGDNDHIGGLDSVLRALPVTEVVSSLPGLTLRAAACEQGRRWEWDGVSFEFFNPPAGITSRHNNASCVLKVAGRHGSILLPGDIELKAERQLVAKYGERLHADVLVAPHHGSKTSSSCRFLNAVRPRHVLFPVGYRNRYHHPHPAVAERYAQMGIEADDSPGAGAIELRLTAAGMVSMRHRDTVRRYWFAR